MKSRKFEKLSFCKDKLGNCLVGKLLIGNISGWENVLLRICRLRIGRLILRICRLRKNRIGNLSFLKRNWENVVKSMKIEKMSFYLKKLGKCCEIKKI